MLHHKSLPEIDKVSTFNTVAPLIEKMAKFGLICQVISFFTETYGTGNFIFKELHHWGFWKAIILALLVAVPIAFTIEYAVYELVVFCTSCFAKGFNRLNKESATIKVLLFIALSVLVVVTLISVFLSKKSITFAFTHKEFKEVVNTNQIEEERKAMIKEIELKHNNLSLEENELSKSRKSVIESKYAALIKKQKVELEVWERKEQREKKSYTTRKLLINKQIADLEKMKAEELLDYNNELFSKNTNATTALEEELYIINKRYDAKIKEAVEKNEKNENTKKEVSSWFAFFLRNLAGLSVFGFLLSRIWVQLAYEEAGIRRKNYYTPSFFESSVAEDVLMYFNLLVVRFIQNPLRKAIQSSPTLLKMDRSKNFVDIKQHNKEIEAIRAKAEAEKAKIRKAEAEAKQKAEAEAEARKAEAEARKTEARKTEELKQKLAEARKAEAEAKQKAEDDIRKAEAEAKQKAEAEARKTEARKTEAIKAMQEKAEAERAKAEAEAEKAKILKAEAERAKAEAEASKSRLDRLIKQKKAEAEAEARKAENTAIPIKKSEKSKTSSSKEKNKIAALAYYNKVLAETGKKPTQKEIGDYLGVSDRAVNGYFKELKEEGKVG